MILLLHNRYRVAGGEERAVEDLAWLIRTELCRVACEDLDVLAQLRADQPGEVLDGPFLPAGDAIAVVQEEDHRPPP